MIRTLVRLAEPAAALFAARRPRHQLVRAGPLCVEAGQESGKPPVPTTGRRCRSRGDLVHPDLQIPAEKVGHRWHFLTFLALVSCIIGLTLVVLGAKVFDLPMGAAGGMLAGSG